MNKIKLSKLANINMGQSPKSENYCNNEGIPFLQGNRTFGEKYPEIDVYTKQITKLAKKGEILISVRAPVGDLNIAPVDLCIGRGLSSINSFDGNNEFLYYCLKYNVRNILKQSSGTTYDSINRDILENFELITPKKEDYIKVGEILSKIDNKIELNNKINSELEAITKTIYDYWFLQFEFPDEEGKPYKSSGGKMVWNDELKREIPEIFKNLLLKEIKNISVITGKTPSTKDETNFGNEVPFITIEDLRENTFVVNTKRKLSKKGANTQEKKYIPSGSICVSCIATIGEIAITTETSQTNQQINSVICEREEIRNYLYFYLKNMFLNFKVKSGNIFSNMNKEEFESIKILLPTENILVKFSEILSSILSKIEINIKENQELTSLRDFLLPLLMNGQIGFKEE